MNNQSTSVRTTPAIDMAANEKTVMVADEPHHGCVVAADEDRHDCRAAQPNSC